MEGGGARKVGGRVERMTEEQTDRQLFMFIVLKLVNIVSIYTDECRWTNTQTLSLPDYVMIILQKVNKYLPTFICHAL